jgi:hypothetical protein
VRVAGVHLQNRRTLWADAGGHILSPLDRVTVRVPDGDVIGFIVAAPEQILVYSGSAQGAVVEVLPPDVGGPDRSSPPGADMPALGSRIRSKAGPGRIKAIDPLHRRVTVQRVDGSEVDMAVEEIEEEGQTIGK